MTLRVSHVLATFLLCASVSGVPLGLAAWAEIPTEATDAHEEDGHALLDAALRSLLRDVRRDARALRIPKSVIDLAFADLTLDMSILDLKARQPEHVMAPWDYMSRLVSEDRITTGRTKVADNAAILEAIEDKTGVDRFVVAAIWGVESSYGTLPGTRSVIRSLVTLSVVDRARPAFWRSELLAALQILAEGAVTPDAMTGSWAGAMGHTQFMPSSFLARAVDFDGDGRRDIWNSIPDALASTATYLAKAGWVPGQPWGVEVVLPAGFDYRLVDAQTARSADEWKRLGLSAPVGRPWPDGLASSALLLPAGMHGPAFLVTSNFEVILKYNRAIPYALSVGHLADRLAGRPALAAIWPIDDPPLDRESRRELQRRLSAAGHTVGAIDGIIGDATREALRDWQGQNGLVPDGWAGARALDLLRSASSD
ncbi:MAG: lytic murein transglycosylase [Hyphomicrobiaceae bacterium]